MKWPPGFDLGDAAAADAAVLGVDVSQPVSGVQAPVEKAPQGVTHWGCTVLGAQ